MATDYQGLGGIHHAVVYVNDHDLDDVPHRHQTPQYMDGRSFWSGFVDGMDRDF